MAPGGVFGVFVLRVVYAPPKKMPPHRGAQSNQKVQKRRRKEKRKKRKRKESDIPTAANYQILPATGSITQLSTRSTGFTQLSSIDVSRRPQSNQRTQKRKERKGERGGCSSLCHSWHTNGCRSTSSGREYHRGSPKQQRSSLLRMLSLFGSMPSFSLTIVPISQPLVFLIQL